MKIKAPRNRTISISPDEQNKFIKSLLHPNSILTKEQAQNKIINEDIFETIDFLPDHFIDLLFVDPPYNLNKKFNDTSFKEMDEVQYEYWIDSWLGKLVVKLKPDASIYICGDWRSSLAILNVAKKYFKVRNRITWEREKGRGAKYNWKNCSEDIWFFTASDKFIFNIEDVKIKRRVIAPYKNTNGEPKDWDDIEEGRYRVTHPSNIWTDITVPFWSMPENTEHPTQKPEKLLAKIILASSNPGDLVFDPFLGSGTTAVVAKKLGRNYSGIEIDEYYCSLAEKRLNEADYNKSIQGYENEVFWERNSLNERKSITKASEKKI
ncbi:MAG TPA: site-specific DNA-methyltransferase [Ignavibacteriaceae bacterium]|nr:site-specific DNA-methyltransferase [Ignavibacteriaceae bacterium]